MSSCLRVSVSTQHQSVAEGEFVPDPGMPLTAIMSRFERGVFLNFSHVFFTSLSTCSSILEGVNGGGYDKEEGI